MVMSGFLGLGCCCWLMAAVWGGYPEHLQGMTGSGLQGWVGVGDVSPGTPPASLWPTVAQVLQGG